MEIGKKNKKRIMLVDDEKDVSFTLKAILEKYGYEVDSFNLSHLALQNFRANFYDLIILDVRMPSMSGFQLCREIKKRDSQVKIIIVSAFELYNEKFKPDLDDIECFIQKPVDSEELIREVQVAIGDDERQ